MINSLLGIKKKQTQHFDIKGKRMPVTILSVGPCPITQIKTVEKDGYSAIQLGLGSNKTHLIKKTQSGHVKKAGLSQEKTPRFFREIEVQELSEDIKPGLTVTVDQVFGVGDTVSVSGISKGKGFASGIKRHHFRGGPATHGQSDRERAPGSIGGTTQIGRVYKGKRMAGRMGGETVTIKGLQVIAVDIKRNSLTLSGLIPGSKRGLVIITKTKEAPRVTSEIPETPLENSNDKIQNEKLTPKEHESIKDNKIEEKETKKEEIKQEKIDEKVKPKEEKKDVIKVENK